MGADRERYRLDLIALPDSAPAVIRLRRVLKALLRSYGFRCLSAVQLPDADSPAADATPVPDSEG